ncbi:hypothetical protein BV25DRAFT_1785090, partial [Artomyces pyxidatus]
DTCAAASAALADPAPPTAAPQQLPVLRKDFLAILTLIYSHTTKLSVALNPASPTPSAALSPLRELTSYANTLASNAAAFHPPAHGAALTAEVRTLATNVLRALHDLSVTHLALYSASSSSKPSKGAAGEEYLVRTGVVHDLITRGQADLPKSNLVAVRRRWTDHGATLADALSELEDEPGDGADDGWDDPELDFGFSAPRAPEQTQLVEKIRNLVKRVAALHTQIASVLLRPVAKQLHPPNPPPTPTNPLLDALLVTAPPLVAAVDELVSRIYDASDLSGARDELLAALSGMAKAVAAFWPGMQDGEDGEGKEGSRRWFAAHFAGLEEGAKSID